MKRNEDAFDHVDSDIDDEDTVVDDEAVELDKWEGESAKKRTSYGFHFDVPPFSGCG